LIQVFVRRHTPLISRRHIRSSGLEKVLFEIVHGLHDIQDRRVHPLSAGVSVRCVFPVDFGLNLGFDPMKVLSMFFKLQAMLFPHVLDGFGMNLSEKFIRLGHQFLDIFRRCMFSHHISFLANDASMGSSRLYSLWPSQFFFNFSARHHTLPVSDTHHFDIFT
jgi:hypothetical protein